MKHHSHFDRDDDPLAFFRGLMWAFALLGVLVLALVLVFWLLPETGPGCVADPQWLGFCSELEVRP